MKQNRTLQELISLFLKFLLIMIFPLQLFGDSFLDLLVLPTTGFLFTPIQNYTQFLDESIWIVSSFGALLRNLAIGALVASPGIFFTYRLSRAPVNKSYWKRGFGYAAVIFAFVFAISIFISINYISPMGY
ncbi:MAG: hypothetical protein ACTSPB_24735, partial [Candidatus Thorarchaeota archaeon]